MSQHYIIKKKNNNSMCYMNYEVLNGYTFKPLNKLDYNNSVVVAKMVLFKPEFIELVLKRKIKRKLAEYLNLLMESSDDDADDSTKVRAVLNDLDRYKRLIMNNYRKYLEDRYVELLLEKIAMIEQELKNKLVVLLFSNEEQEEQIEKEEEHKRRR